MKQEWKNSTPLGDGKIRTSYEIGKYVCKNVFGENPTGTMLNFCADIVQKIRDENWEDFYVYSGMRDVPYDESIIDEAIARIIEKFSAIPLRLTIRAHDIEHRILNGLR